ncbi:MAG: hypothetical protein VYC39_06235 [Myxococcota bacterium]|nr:hypothetical protein [Myxococcota bacterium]
MKIEIDNLENIKAHLEKNPDFSHVVVQGLDLRDYENELLARDVHSSVFLGCHMSDEVAISIQKRGGVIFPSLDAMPYRLYRNSLYSPQELSEGYNLGDYKSIAKSRDALVYEHYRCAKENTHKPPVAEALAQRLHDHSIDDALADFLDNDGKPRKVVAIMGGHSMLRTDTSFRKVARIAHKLANLDSSVLVATGGGPGAMEASNLGAFLSNQPIDAIDLAIERLSAAPSYKDEAWWDTALTVINDCQTSPGTSLGIPTWYYGHEPPNLFATHIAKYFSNSLREDGLLTIATHGVIYAPGSAGTIQEVFLDACQNHYGSTGLISPMVFLNTNYWSETKPVYPLLSKLAHDRQYGSLLTALDDEDEIVRFIEEHPPEAVRQD